MTECGMAEFVRRRESLNGKLALGSYHHALAGIVDVRPEQILKRPEHHGDVSPDQHAKHVDPSLAALRARLGVVFLVQPIRLVNGVQDFIASCHDSSPLLLLPGAQEIRKPPQFLTIIGREFGDLTGQVFDICAESDVLGFFAGEVTDGAFVEAGQFLQLQGIHLPLSGLHERQGGPRDAQESGDLILREAEVLPRFPEPLTQGLPIVILVVGLRLCPCSFAHLWVASLGPDPFDPLEHVLDRLIHAVVTALPNDLVRRNLEGEQALQHQHRAHDPLRVEQRLPLRAKHGTLVGNFLEFDLKTAFHLRRRKDRRGSFIVVSVWVAIDPSFLSMIPGDPSENQTQLTDFVRFSNK